MSLGGLDASIAHAKALVEHREKHREKQERIKREDPIAEAAVASYYLQEKYSSSESSSNRDELESFVKSYELTELRGNDSGDDVWNLLTQREFRARKADLSALFDRAISNHYKAVEDDEMDLKIHSNCLSLFERDYRVQILKNPGGALSWNYPVRMIIPVIDQRDEFFRRSPIFTPEDINEFCEMSKQACVARCRNRFPIPVIYCRGKYICRSGTLAVRKGIAFGALTQAMEPESREVFENPFASLWGGIRNIAKRGRQSINRIVNAVRILLDTSMDEIKDMDVKILNLLKVEVICDMMVEDRKVHTGIRVGSSEKINLRKYGIFCTLKIPYPGCEFFRQYGNAGRRGEGLVYRWDSPEVTSSLGFIRDEDIDGELPYIGIEWQNYMDWDLVTLTRNYMRVLLHLISHPDYQGLLVHCISGWDRTPLFISLLRIALWADHLCHQTLDALEMAYLTVAYDWYLFGHDLPTRLRKKEEIMHFCFSFLPELLPDEFVVQHSRRRDQQREHLYMRKKKLMDIHKILLKFYEQKVKI